MLVLHVGLGCGSLSIPSLKVRRMRTKALESFKILNNLSPAYLNDLLTFKNHSYKFR